MQNYTSRTYSPRYPQAALPEDPLADVGGHALEGSGFEAEQADTEFVERVESLQEVDA